MAAFDLIELSLDPLDVTPTLEDEFTSTVVKNEIDNLDDIDHVKIASNLDSSLDFKLFQIYSISSFSSSFRSSD